MNQSNLGVIEGVAGDDAAVVIVEAEDERVVQDVLHQDPSFPGSTWKELLPAELQLIPSGKISVEVNLKLMTSSSLAQEEEKQLLHSG